MRGEFLKRNSNIIIYKYSIFSPEVPGYYYVKEG